ncbi:hypothetical protein LMG28614_03199 [Paraburkholderia ultramafica]|uniref:Uncharacterized protein n=2 Tax=Paraburkholderia ultramafica TaxID=1544867 RepID=A0A6S7B7Q9_9BURK|nr:hypothetical protein LMG28614_03199 [Paraburkholderia ultramafica]
MYFSSDVPAIALTEKANVTACDKVTCAIALGDDGYVFDVNSRKKLFEQPLQETVFDSYTLSKAGQYYILERSNTTSSRNWSVFIFRYGDGGLYADKLITLSRSYSISPHKIKWGGFECRGESAVQKKYSPFDSAEIALCGEKQESKSIDTDHGLLKHGASGGLTVSVPVYGAAAEGISVYKFVNSDEPDVDAMQCIKNCDGYITKGWYKK